MTIRFMDVFTEWAASYDDAVTGHDPQYKDVFLRYDEILDAVAERAMTPVTEFGAGTGNLTGRLLARGIDVTAVEPSPEMREILIDKIKDVNVQDGHFLSFEAEGTNSFVSTYAFHHLTDTEKGEAIGLMADILPVGGKIVYADTMFLTEQERLDVIREAREKQFDALADDLEGEYYTIIPVVQELFEKQGFNVSFERQNKFVWLVEAEKMEESA